ncbi:putative kelch-type beta propeller [Rosa chinensis]|uniref:Putative kelch-type beta propeller n=1 Tax=Rosa chinensis TaxID=74649 RepID=A0A2P6RJI4_ROSCH|nr:putative kelch-type beta propeller [Rosa chinensis]
MSTSSKKPLDVTTRHCSEHRHKAHKHTRDGKKKKKKTKETTKPKLKLEVEEANKSLYMCILEHGTNWAAYVVRTIKLSDLLSSSAVGDDPLPLRQVAYEAGSHLPGSVGCGVWGSQIVFTGGVTPSSPHGFRNIGPDSVWHTNVYAFETHTNEIRKLDANLQGGKLYPLTVELGGKLYALSYRLVGHPPSFEVFDPKIGKWEGLPQPPFFQVGSPYYEHASFSYAIAGTKIFASHEECPVFCFDVAHPDRDWRLVSTMCRGGPFPFDNKVALVLDLQGDDDKKIMFAYSHEPWRLWVYLMSLSENQEIITKIGDLRMPLLPDEFGLPQRCEFLHIGGQKACLVVTEIGVRAEDAPAYNELGTHKRHGAVIPFQFEVDITKVDKDKKNCLALQFMPLRSFEYHTNPPTLPEPETVGCFLL